MIVFHGRRMDSIVVGIPAGLCPKLFSSNHHRQQKAKDFSFNPLKCHRQYTISTLILNLESAHFISWPRVSLHIVWLDSVITGDDMEHAGPG